ncbi:MAG TPA: DMT family transporter [Gaiellaceae bacterium]|nr:DMT family transporter [Gaiellaceae bacterium]
MSTRATGIALALATAAISGVAVFLNAYAVKHVGDATAYTTAKNAVAALILFLLALPTLRGPREPGRPAPRPRSRRDWLALSAVGVVGGSVPFVLFFEGLARASSTEAAFIHKTLVVWVALLAVPLLGERLSWLQGAAIALLVLGQAVLVGGTGTVTVGQGEVMILAATLLWAGEVVFVKYLLRSLAAPTLAAARLGIGTLLLVGFVLASGRGGEIAAYGASEWGWALLTGLVLAGYVATWYAALARAQAVDVTAVLVLAAIVTALLNAGFEGAPVDALGLGLIALGGVLIVARALGRAYRPATA